MHAQDKERAIAVLNRILELELAGVVRYTHYALMIYGYNRIPIVSWLSGQADESLLHARRAGELITQFGGHPSLGHEKLALAAYYDLLELATGKSVLLEEYARELIAAEELHAGEVNKMLRKPGDIAEFTG